MPIGKPKFKVGDKIKFKWYLLPGEKKSKYIEGEVGIVDAYGIFGDNSQVYYDAWVNIGKQRVFVKHIPEKDCRKVAKCKK